MAIRQEVTTAVRQVLSDHQLRLWNRFSTNLLSLIGGGMIAILVIIAVFAPILAPDPTAVTGQTDFANQFQSPSLVHPLGTDDAGRDILSRIIYGSRISLTMAVSVIAIALSIGVPLGLVAGYVGGPFNQLVMRAIDIFIAIPPILMAMVLVAALGPGLLNVSIALGIALWPWYARLVQGEVISVKEEQFVEASESIGASWYYISFREIFPNVISPLTVKATLDMGGVIMLGAALSFLGLGTQPPTADWGVMIADGRAYVTNYWWISTFPGLAISFAVLGFNFLGDALRDVFDVEVQE